MFDGCCNGMKHLGYLKQSIQQLLLWLSVLRYKYTILTFPVLVAILAFVICQPFNG